MKKRFDELGIPNKMTREEDSYLPKEERIKKVLSLYNDSPNTILLSNHINAGGGEGVEVVYSLKNDSSLAESIFNNIIDRGQVGRKIYQRRLPENPNLDYYYILRESGKTTPILIEYGFIDNKKDAAKLNNNIEEYVEGVVQAIAEYLGYPYLPSTEEPAYDFYVVEKGDTLYSISKKMNVPIEVIKKINNLDSTNLSIGQKLFFSGQEKPTEEYYMVQKGDTLYSISKKFQIDINVLKEINKLPNDILSIGQKLWLQKKEPNTNPNIYIVQKGDSLWKIAKDHNITVTELIENNNLTDLTIQIGQELMINPIQNDYYIVKKGDTLWSVAKLHQLTVDELKELNNLKNNMLSIGQQLKIK